MNKLILQKAKKILKPLKGFLYGPTFSGKTYSALMLANGFVQSIRNCTEEEAYKHILLIDTEYGRGALYNKLGEYNYVEVTAPYNTDILVSYINQINDMDEIDVVVIDSMTHFWTKKGGILDQKAEADKQGGNSYTNWLAFTTKFNEAIDTLMASPKHVLITARAKSDTALVENAKGKMEPRTYGLKPEIRDGFEYECDFTFNIDKSFHDIIVEKGIPGMDPSYAAATPDLGKIIYELHTKDASLKVRDINEIATSIRNMSAKNQALIHFVQLQLSGRKLEELDLSTITKLEKDVIAEYKKLQVK